MRQTYGLTTNPGHGLPPFSEITFEKQYRKPKFGPLFPERHLSPLRGGEGDLYTLERFKNTVAIQF